MIIKKLELNYFKIFHHQIFNFEPHLNFIIGKNGIGKTTLIEAIALTLWGIPHLKKSYSQFCQFNHNEFWTKLDLQKQQTIFTFLLLYSSSRTKKVHTINKEKYPNSKKIIELFPFSVFFVQDSFLFLQSPQWRRSLLDRFICLNDINVFTQMNKYLHILKQRNHALKHKNYSLLNFIDEQFISQSIIIANLRNKMIDKINKKIKEWKLALPWAKNFLIRYIDLSLDDNFENKVKQIKNKDLTLNYTTLGAHRGDFNLYDSNNRLLTHVLSRGQQKILSTLFILSMHDILATEKKYTPLFLADDLLSELDAIHQHWLIDTLKSLPGQKIITHLFDQKFLNHPKINKINLL